MISPAWTFGRQIINMRIFCLYPYFRFRPLLFFVRLCHQTNCFSRRCIGRRILHVQSKRYQLGCNIISQYRLELWLVRIWNVIDCLRNKNISLGHKLFCLLRSMRQLPYSCQPEVFIIHSRSVDTNRGLRKQNARGKEQYWCTLCDA